MQLMDSLVEHPNESYENNINIIFSLMLQNLNKNSILDFLFVILAYMQGGLWKKHLITSFVKHFTENVENTLCIVFQFYNQKLS